MKSKYYFLIGVVGLAISFLTTAPWACEIKAPLEQIECPKASAWVTHFNTSQDKPFIEQANQMTHVQQKETSLNLFLKKRYQSFYYSAALINNPNTPSPYRDVEIIESACRMCAWSSWINQLPCKEVIWQENVKLLSFVANKAETSNYHKGLALYYLGTYHNPADHLLVPDPSKAKQFYRDALKCGELQPEVKASALNNIAMFFENEHFGKDQKKKEKAYNYYHQIDTDSSLPLEQRLQARISKARVLLCYSNFPETLHARQQLIQSVLEEKGVTPALKAQATLYKNSYLIEKYDFMEEAEQDIRKKSFFHIPILIALHKLKQSTSLLDDVDIQGLNLNYAHCIYEVKRLYGVQAFEKVGLRDDSLACILRDDTLDQLLKELIHQEQPPQIDNWALSVLLAAQLMLNNNCTSLPCLGNKNMKNLLLEIARNPDIISTSQNSAKSLLACLSAYGLLSQEPNEDVDILKGLQDTLQDINIPKNIKFTVLAIFGQKAYERYPRYHPEIGKIIDYLQNALIEEKSLYLQSEIKYLLVTYYLAYPECALETQVVSQYVLDLSSNETPEQFRINIIMDDDSDESSEGPSDSKPDLKIKEGVDIKSEKDAVIELAKKKTTDSTLETGIDFAPKTADPIETSSLPESPEIGESQSESDEEARELEKELNSYATTPRKALKVLPQTAAPIETINTETPDEAPTLDPKLERDIKKAELLLEDLESTHQMAYQREVQNMFRRLGFNFNPTAEEGLTIHLGHKKGNNKKGTPGKLDGGRKSDLARVLEKAIQQAKNPQPPIESSSESRLKPSKKSQQTKQKKNKKQKR